MTLFLNRAQGPYVATRAGVEPTTLWAKGIDSTNSPPRPTNVGRGGAFYIYARDGTPTAPRFEVTFLIKALSLLFFWAGHILRKVYNCRETKNF